MESLQDILKEEYRRKKKIDMLCIDQKLRWQLMTKALERVILGREQTELDKEMMQMEITCTEVTVEVDDYISITSLYNMQELSYAIKDKYKNSKEMIDTIQKNKYNALKYIHVVSKINVTGLIDLDKTAYLTREVYGIPEDEVKRLQLDNFRTFMSVLCDEEYNIIDGICSIGTFVTGWNGGKDSKYEYTVGYYGEERVNRKIESGSLTKIAIMQLPAVKSRKGVSHFIDGKFEEWKIKRAVRI